MIFKRTLFFLSLLLLSGPVACSQLEKSAIPKFAYDAYQSGKPVILFSYKKIDTNTEAFADWSAYLSDFKQGKGQSYIYIKVGHEALGNIKPKPTEFTLFLKKIFLFITMTASSLNPRFIVLFIKFIQASPWKMSIEHFCQMILTKKCSPT